MLHVIRAKVIYYIDIDCCILNTQFFTYVINNFLLHSCFKGKTNNFIENYNYIWASLFCI